MTDFRLVGSNNSVKQRHMSLPRGLLEVQNYEEIRTLTYNNCEIALKSKNIPHHPITINENH